jgi:hypothetical protein
MDYRAMLPKEYHAIVLKQMTGNTADAHDLQ